MGRSSRASLRLAWMIFSASTLSTSPIAQARGRSGVHVENSGILDKMAEGEAGTVRARWARGGTTRIQDSGSPHLQSNVAIAESEAATSELLRLSTVSVV